MLIKLPNKVRQFDEREQEISNIKPMEILISLMALSRYNGVNSLVTMNTLQLDYNIPEGQFKSKKNSPKLVDYLHDADNNRIINWINRKDYKNRNSSILVDMVELEKNYITLDYEKVNKILKSDLRMDVKAITVYTYVILVAKSGFRNFEKEDYSNPNRQKGYCFPGQNRLSKHVNSSIEAVKSALKNLKELNLIEILNHDPYKTRNKEGDNVIKQLTNSYIIKQEGWEIIKEEALQDIELLEQKTHKDKIKSQMITQLTNDNYNSWEEICKNESEINEYRLNVIRNKNIDNNDSF